MSRRRLAIGIGVAGAAAVAVAATVLAFVPLGEHHDANPPASGKPLPSQTGTQSPGSAGVRPPDKGAYLGAWVKPTQFTERGRLAATEGFQRDVGRSLDIVQDYHKWNDEFPSPFDQDVARAGQIPLISWAGTDTKLIALGDEDEVIHTRARAVKALGAPILLRWRWEMERPNLRQEVHSPKDYIAAWKRIRAIFAADGVTNASFVWCPLADGFDSGKAPAYYPGDDQVDWVCADAYSLAPSKPLSSVLATFLQWARSHDKPIVIAEFGTQPGQPGDRARWLAEIPALLQQNPRLKALVYFDSDTDENGVSRQWSLRWDTRDVDAFAALAKDPVLNPRKLSAIKR